MYILTVVQFRIQLAMIKPNENNMLKFPNNVNNCWNVVGYSHTSWTLYES